MEKTVKLLKWSREVHKWSGLVFSLLFFLLSVTGVLLVFREDFGFQPQTYKGEKADIAHALSIDEMVRIATSQGFEDFTTAKDVNRLDIRPNKNVVKIMSEEGREIQIEMTTGNILNVDQRTDRTLEALHDGSYFGDWFKYILVTASGVILILLCISAYYMVGFKYWKRQKNNKAKLNSKVPEYVQS